MSPAKPWYVDAWAVHDGKVFASRRPPESIDADVTVFMSVPDLEPVPVGRISTALRATRSGFQEGLRTGDGEAVEVPFESLGQIRELVRRAYLAAGLGPGSPGATGGPLPRPETGPDGSGPGRAFLEREADLVPGGWTGVDGPEPPAGLDQAVRLIVAATVLAWDPHLATDNPEEIRGLVGWIAALRRSGLLESYADHRRSVVPAGLFDLADEFHAEHLARALHVVRDSWTDSPWALDEPISGYWSRGHLASVPLSAAPGWNPAVRRLADMQMIPLVDVRFWMSMRPVRALDIAPLVLVHAVRQPPRTGRLPGEPSPAEAAYRRAWPAMAWYRGGLLPAAAEEELALFIDRCLQGPPSGRPGPGSSRPGAPPDAPVPWSGVQSVAEEPGAVSPVWQLRSGPA
jgi:hypothetical protein